MSGEHWWILVDQGKRAAQDRRGRSAIHLQHNAFGTRELSIEQLESRARCAAKPVDGLVRIADRKDIPFRAGEASENFDLGNIGILKFVRQDEAGARAHLIENTVVAMQ